MGATLTKNEEREIASYLLGIEPEALAIVIYDTINSAEVDEDSYGISFEREGHSSTVRFWDNGEATEMPRRAFLVVLEMMSGRIIDEYERDYNLDKSPELKAGVDKLILAKQQLQHELEDQAEAEDYWSRLERPASKEYVQEVQQRRWAGTGAKGETATVGGRRTSKGLEAVVDRLPELRSRYEEATKGKKSLSKVRSKLLALGGFRGKVHPENSLKEEEEEVEVPSESYKTQRRPTLSMINWRPSVTSFESTPSGHAPTPGASPPSLTYAHPVQSRDSVVDIP